MLIVLISKKMSFFLVVVVKKANEDNWNGGIAMEMHM